MPHHFPRRAPAWRRLSAASVSLGLVASLLVASPVAANGELDWADQFGSAGFEQALGVATTDDAVYVAGDAFPTFLRKYLHNGDMVWERTLPAGAMIKDVDADASAVYVSGVTDVALPGQPTPHGLESFVARYSPAGSLIWARQFLLPALGGLRAGNGSSQVQLTSAGVFVAGEGDSASFLRLYDRDGNTLWTRNVPQRLQTLSADDTGALVISATAAWNSPTMRSFDNSGALRFTRPVPGVYLHRAAPAAGGGFYVGYKTFVAPGGPSRGFVTRYNAGGLATWTHRYGGDLFADWGDLREYGGRLYLTWTESDVAARPLGHWAAVSRTTGAPVWHHEFAVDPGTSLFPYSIAVGPQGGYIAGGIEGALAGQVDHGDRDAFLMKFTIDTSPPNILFTGYAPLARVRLTLDGFTGRASWSLSDDLSGVRRVELQESSDGTQWNDVLLPEPEATEALIDVKPNGEHRFRVRATDRSGNVSKWSLSKLFRTDLLQESAAGATYDTNWQPATLAGASGGSVMTTSTAGATAKLQFTGDAIGLVATLGPDRGRVTVFVDGVRVKTVDLQAPRTSTRWVVFTRPISTVGTHLLTLVAEGTAGRPRVDIDAFEVRSTFV